MAELVERVRSGVLLGLPLGWWLGLCLSLGVSTFFAPAAMLSVALLWQRREALISALLKSVATVNARGMVVGFLMIWPLLWTVHGSMTPADDVLRHLTAWQHGFDYHRLYAHLDPRFPHVSMWIGYEWVAGALHRALGLQLAILALQWLIYAAAAYCVWRVVLVAVPDSDDAWTWRLLVVAVLMLTQLLFRVTMARPEVVLAVWALCAVWMRPWLWVAVGLAVQPLYWLAIVYVPAALLLQTDRRTQLFCAAAVVAGSVAFWLGYAGSDWPGFFLLLREWMQARLGGVSENESIFLALRSPAAVLTLGLLLWRGRVVWQRDWPLIVLLAWFLLPGQIRYLGTVHALLVLLLLRSMALPRLVPELRLAVWGGVLVASAYLGAAGGQFVDGFGSGLPHFRGLPHNAQVLTAFDAATYVVPAENPGIRSAPAMELGATTPSVQTQVLALGGHGVLDCDIVRTAGFTHVVERRMAVARSCLQLVEISNGWRLWRVAGS